jgi:hypothetical protein
MSKQVDPKFLALFMLLSTQQNWAGKLLPENLPPNTEPDYDNTPFSDVNDKTHPGVPPDIQRIFFQVFGSSDKPSKELSDALSAAAKSKTQRDAYRSLFDILTAVLVLDNPINYSPPPCPRAETLRDIVQHINTLPIELEDDRNSERRL